MVESNGSEINFKAQQRSLARKMLVQLDLHSPDFIEKNLP